MRASKPSSSSDSASKYSPEDVSNDATVVTSKKAKRRSQPDPLPVRPPSNPRPRPQITLPVPTRGYFSTRRPNTPKQSSRRPATPKQTNRRPGTPKRASVVGSKFSRRRRDSRPGSSKSNKSFRCGRPESQIHKDTEPGSLMSNCSGSPAYLSCLDDYMSLPSAKEPTPNATPHPHILCITDTFTHDASRVASPALASASSWKLEKSLDELWGWRDGEHGDPSARTSIPLSSASDDTLADEEDVPENLNSPEELSPTTSGAFDVNHDAPSSTTLTSEYHIPSVKPLTISRPTLCAPPQTEHSPQRSSPYTISPSSTLVASPTTPDFDHPTKHQDVWNVIHALKLSWEEDETGGDADVLEWLFGRPARSDESDDGLLSLRRLTLREKRLGNYI
ncbi:hypothetical protein FRB99_005383 [Tulasnella sp. 403]|nr:hypothetical protein FRB99_005383 [Tulasnella sp. 403]